MKARGACSCGAVVFVIDGPVRDVLVCHCAACREATGRPWSASAAHRSNLVIEDERAVEWVAATDSEHEASRGRCRRCSDVVFWDAPGRDTISFAAESLGVSPTLEIAAHIWVRESERGALLDAGYRVEPAGLPAPATVTWRS